jgi:hypothetical protein
MSRAISSEYRNAVLEVIKKHYIINGNSPVNLTLIQIAEDVGEKNPKNKVEKIMRMVNDLERRGNIKVFKEQGSNVRRFEFIKDNSPATIDVIKVMAKDTDGVIDQVLKATKAATDMVITTNKELVDKITELNYYLSKIAVIEVFGTSPDGSKIFMQVDANTNFDSVINQAKGLLNKYKNDEEAAATAE